jgi:uncharacterized protein (TIGR03067 family)
MRCKSCGLAIVALFGVVGLLLASSMQTGDDVLKKIQGTWRFTELSGVPADQLKELTITFKGDKFTLRNGDEVVQWATHKFDSSTKPGHFDAVITEGIGKDKTMLGIFELKGDTIRFCFGVGKERPTSFTAKENQMSATVKREKK